MQESREAQLDNPLRSLTEAQFMALGGNAVVYVKHVKAEDLTDLIDESEIDASDDYHIVVSADGSPLMVADSEEAVVDWLAGKNFDVVTLH